MEENNNIVDSTDKNGQYCQPTYGYNYPTGLDSAEESESTRFFRPIRFYNSTEELSEEEEDMDTAVSGSGAGGGEPEDATSSSAQLDPISGGGVEVKLHNRSLWKAFMDIGNEMIVTKPGR